MSWVFTSLISGSNNRLSVTRVITVSVKVDLVMVSVTVPSSVGAGGNIGTSGTAFWTVTVTEGPCSPASTCTWPWRPPLIKCDGIIAWKSALVMGRAATWTARMFFFSICLCGCVFVVAREKANSWGLVLGTFGERGQHSQKTRDGSVFTKRIQEGRKKEKGHNEKMLRQQVD